MQHRQIFILALLRLLRIAPESARHTAAVERQFARKLITAHPRAPHGKALLRQNVPRHAHPTMNSAKLFILLWIEETALIVRIEKLTHDAAFAAQRKEDDHQSDDEGRPHDHKISHKESDAATENRRAVPGRVH